MTNSEKIELALMKLQDTIYKSGLAPHCKIPCVPVQFVYDCRTSKLMSVEEAQLVSFLDCEVEQVGAVLYVRGK